MATKQLETISGAVEQVNTKGTGIKVLGEWLNTSQYHPIATMPTAGQLVEVQIERTDRGPWINNLKIIGDTPGLSSSRPDRVSVRLAVLHTQTTGAQMRGVVAASPRPRDVPGGTLVLAARPGGEVRRHSTDATTRLVTASPELG